MSLLSSPGHFGTLCPKVRERACDFISPHIPAGRRLPCEQLHTGQIAHTIYKFAINKLQESVFRSKIKQIQYVGVKL